MNINKEIILTDTNIISDLSIAGLLDTFVKLDNTYIWDIIKYHEINTKTGDLDIINQFKVIEANEKEVYLSVIVAREERISNGDAIGYVLAKNHNYLFATGDGRLSKVARNNGVKVIGTIGIIDYLYDIGVISISIRKTACKKLLDCTTTRLPKDELIKRT